MVNGEAAHRNPHEQSDALRVWGRAFFQRMEMEYQERVQGLTNYEAMYAEQKALADKWREEAGRLRAERDKARAELMRLSSPTYHGPYHEDAGVRGVDDV